ncbi:MAG: hypothetical protein Q9162_003704 [Coniocarpon cinnabarinum]
MSRHIAWRPLQALLRSPRNAQPTKQKPPPQRNAPAKAPEPVVSTRDSVSAAPPSTRRTGGQLLRTYKPRTPGVRHLKRPINDHLWKGRPHRPLTFAKKGRGRGGRNNTGRVTVRHRGGGHKRRIRIVDFQRTAIGPHTVERIEHDPNRSAHIALVKSNKTDTLSYIIAAEGMRDGDVVESYRSGIPDKLIKEMGGTLDPGMLAAKTAVRGNCMPIKMVPIGMQVFNVGSRKGGAAVFCRSAGTYATISAKEENRKGVKEVVVRLQSGELRRVDPNACATIGVVSNPHFHFRQLGKAGRKRWMGIRPTVRGMAMNASDHPHGGGRGKSKGNKPPQSPWGTPAKSGYKTRKKRNVNKHMVRDRPRNQGKRRRTS